MTNQPNMKPCISCKGTGLVNNGEIKCSWCGGDGQSIERDFSSHTSAEQTLSDCMRIRAKHHCPDEDANNLLYAGANRIDELERHLERVLSWKETTEMIAPELGGLIKQMNVAKGVLSND